MTMPYALNETGSILKVIGIIYSPKYKNIHNTRKSFPKLIHYCLIGHQVWVLTSPTSDG